MCRSVQWNQITYHLERVELLLDLLCQDGSQAVAGCNVATAIVVGSTPSIMELNARRECDDFATGGSRGHAAGVRHRRDTRLTEVVIVCGITE